jgi:hypothetical protein
MRPGTLIVDAYIENIGNRDVRVVTGKLLSLEITRESAVYHGDAEHAPDGKVIRASPGVVDLVELKPGEVAKLGRIVGPVYGDNVDYLVVYEISEALGTMEGCWSGRIESTFKMHWADSKADQLK